MLEDDKSGKLGSAPMAIQRHLSGFRRLSIWEDADGIVGYFDALEEGLIW
jgi:hypothetical protein